MGLLPASTRECFTAVISTYEIDKILPILNIGHTNESVVYPSGRDIKRLNFKAVEPREELFHDRR